MSIQNRITRGVAAVAAASMLMASTGPTSAFSALGALPQNSVAAASPIEKVWCQWGCGPGPLIGGFVAGAVVGAAVASAATPAYPPGYYSYGPAYNYGPCWQRWVGPYGGVHWRRVC